MSTCQSKSSTMLFFFVAASCLLAVQSQSIFPGNCPTVSVMSPFDITQYAGSWYENTKYFAIFELGQKCIKAKYTVIDDSTAEVQNSGIKTRDGEATSVTGKVTVIEVNTGNLAIAYRNLDEVPSTANYLVLGTDYTSYAVVWSCNNLFFFNTQFLWILTRDREPSDDVINSALAVIESNGLNKNKLRKTDQTNCT